MENYIKQIKKEYLIKFIKFLFYSIFMLLPCWFIVYSFSQNPAEAISYVFSDFWNFIAIFIFLCIFLLDVYLFYNTYTTYKYYRNPLTSPVFLKFNNIEEVIDNINNNIIYQDHVSLLSEKYILSKKDHSCILSYLEILGVYMEIHKTNLVIDRYTLILYGKYKEEVLRLEYRPNEKEIINELMNKLMLLCPNAKFGYSNDTFNYIRYNQEKLINKD